MFRILIINLLWNNCILYIYNQEFLPDSNALEAMDFSLLFPHLKAN